MAGNPNPLLKIQKQIKENAEDLRNYVEDLYDWEESVEKKPKNNQKKISEIKAPVRGEAQINIENEESEIQQEIREKKEKNKNLVRDANTVQDYYKAWDKFNVDEELKDFEKEELLEKQKQLDKMNPYMQSNKTKAPARAKIQIKGGRGPLNPINSLRDKGNLFFKSTEYKKAIEQYTECINLFATSQITRDEQDLYVTIYSNRAMAYLKLYEYSNAEQDCNSALKLNPNHEKSLYRRALSRKKMQKLKDAIKDFEMAAEINPGNKEIQRELKLTQAAYKQVREKAKQSLLMPIKEDKYQQNLEVLDVENNDVFEGQKYFDELEVQEELDKEDFENEIYEDDGSGSSLSEKLDENLEKNNLDDLDGDDDNEEEEVEIRPFGKLKMNADKIKYHDHEYNKEEQLKQQITYDKNDQKELEQDEKYKQEFCSGKFSHLKNIESFHSHRQESPVDIEEQLKHDVHFVNEVIDIEANEKKHYDSEEVPKIGIMADHENDQYAFIQDIDGKIIKQDEQQSDKKKLLKKFSQSKEGKALDIDEQDISIGKDHDLKFGGEEELEKSKKSNRKNSENVKPKKSIINPDSIQHYKKILQEQEEDIDFVEKQNKFKSLIDVEGKILSHREISDGENSGSESDSNSKSNSCNKIQETGRRKSISFGGEEIIAVNSENSARSRSRSKTPRRSILKGDFYDQITLLQKEENFNSDKLKNIDGKLIKHHQYQEESNLDQNENQNQNSGRAAKTLGRQQSIKFDESNISKGGEILNSEEREINPKKYKRNLKPRRSILKAEQYGNKIQRAYSEYQYQQSDDDDDDSVSGYESDEDQKHVQFQEIAKVDIIQEEDQSPSNKDEAEKKCKSHKKGRNLKVKSILKPKGTYQKNRSKSMRVPSVKAFGLNSSDQKIPIDQIPQQKTQLQNQQLSESELQEKKEKQQKQKREKLNKDLTDFSVNKRILKEGEEEEIQLQKQQKQQQLQQQQQDQEQKEKNEQKDEQLNVQKKEKIQLKTQIQFTQSWANFRRDQQKQFEYLEQIDPSVFREIFKQGMDVRLIQDIFICLNNNYEMNPKLCLEYLENIPKVKRFEINRMSMLAKEKQSISEVLSKLKNNQQIDEEEFKKHIKTYQI